MGDRKLKIEPVPQTRLSPNALSRRQLFKAAGGLGLAVSSGVWAPALAEADSSQESCISPLPIPHVTTPPGTHFFFPGPVTGVAFSTDPPEPIRMVAIRLPLHTLRASSVRSTSNSPGPALTLRAAQPGGSSSTLIHDS